jgi:RNA polymerase sigma factor (sigma-70 family)
MDFKTDLELLRDWKEQGSEPAFAEVVRRHQSLVLGVCRRWSPQLAEDCAQKTFIVLAQRTPVSKEPTGSVAGWLVTTAKQIASAENRSHSGELRRQSRWWKETMETQESHREPDPVLIARIEGGLERLTIEDREALLLHFAENRPYSDLASHLGVSENTARMRVQRALERLQRRLGLSASALTLGLKGIPTGQPNVELTEVWASAAIQSPSLSPIGNALLGITIMTTVQKTILAGSAIALAAFLGIGGKAIANQSRRPSGEENLAEVAKVYAPLTGNWKGKLTYADFKTGRLHSYPITVKLLADSRTLFAEMKYSDPQFDSKIRLTVKPSERKLTIEDDSVTNLNLISYGPGNVVAEGDSVIDEKKTFVRFTVKNSASSALVMQERRTQDGWKLMNKYELERAR